jgi:hypothetical protein
MDKFDELMEWMRMTSRRGTSGRMMSLAKEQCICRACPLFSDCSRAKNEILFCIIGRGKDCTYDASLDGCLCPQCPLTEEYDLSKAYYCALGSEKELRERGAPER